MRQPLTFLTATTAITADIGHAARSAMRAETRFDNLSASLGMGDARRPSQVRMN